jgi:hypothetical protein
MDPSRAVITRADTDKLRAMRAPGAEVLSLYLSIPVDVAGHRALPARIRELVKSAAAAPRRINVQAG